MSGELIKKFCPRCQRHKSLRSFHNDQSREDGKYPWCALCRRNYDKGTNNDRDHNTGDLSRLCPVCSAGIGGSHPNVIYCSQKCSQRASLARMYGLSTLEYQDAISINGGKCPICDRVVRRWCMDHNHETGETYGPVCNSCNTKLLAWTFHDPEVARRLLEFLTNPPIREMYGPRYVTAKKTAQADASINYNDPLAYPHGVKRRSKRQPRKRKR